MEIAAAPVERSGEAKRTVGVARQRAKQKARLGLRLKAGGSHRTGQGPMVPEVLMARELLELSIQLDVRQVRSEGE
jgi:hypothetical protein